MSQVGEGADTDEAAALDATALPNRVSRSEHGGDRLRNTSAVQALVADWIEIFESQPNLEYDQPAFREALYAPDLRLTVLTSEYNLRACFPYFLGGDAEVKIIHARDHCLDEAIAHQRAAPKALLPRVVTPCDGAARAGDVQRGA